MARPIRELNDHWHHFFDGHQFSTKEFYTLVEENIKNRQVPDGKLSRIYLFQDFGFWKKREYLRIRNKDYISDICVAPYGTGYFVSWWTGIPRTWIYRFLVSIPFLGEMIESWSGYRTYYQYDTAIMFQECVKKSVQSALDQITKDKGIRPPTESERQPKPVPSFLKRRGM